MSTLDQLVWTLCLRALAIMCTSTVYMYMYNYSCTHIHLTGVVLRTYLMRPLCNLYINIPLWLCYPCSPIGPVTITCMCVRVQVEHLRDFILFRFSMGFIDNVIAKCKLWLWLLFHIAHIHAHTTHTHTHTHAHTHTHTHAYTHTQTLLPLWVTCLSRVLFSTFLTPDICTVPIMRSWQWVNSGGSSLLILCLITNLSLTLY